MTKQTQAQEPAPAAAAVQTSPVVAAGAPDLARRSFLRAAPLGALAVVAGGTGAAGVPAVLPAAPAPPAKRGYHETEHIRRYYQTAAYW